MARIAIFDYRIVATNPVGGCHLRMLRELCKEHRFTVFAVEFDNPDPGRIEFVRIPAPRRPLAALFAGFHVLAPLAFAAHRLRGGERFDIVQMVESNLAFGDISYSQFCHRAYLRDAWKRSRPEGLRRALRWLDHRLHAIAEPWVLRRVRTIVVPSRGLAREMARTYPKLADKILVLPNAVDTRSLERPAGFDRDGFRRDLGVSPSDTLLTFVALGHFERKGLPFVLESLRRIGSPQLKLLVAGGSPDLVRAYQRRAAELGLEENTRFVGARTDVRPYLWSGDAFVFPSAYETFSLACYEAAAAGLPVLAPRLHGVEEILAEGQTGFIVEPSADSVTSAVRRLMALTPSEREELGDRARLAVTPYAAEGWAERWRSVYARAGHARPALAVADGDAGVA